MLLLILAVIIVIGLFLSIHVVPQAENHLVERFGRYDRTLKAGLNLVVPFLDRVPTTGRVSIVERQLPQFDIPAITQDNVTIALRLAILYRVIDASKSVYRIQNIDSAIQATVVGTVRSVIGKTELDGVQTNRRTLATEMQSELGAVCDEWGIVLSRVEIIDVEVDDETRSAMGLQLNAERSRRALVREAEGQKEATMLRADAELYAADKSAEAQKLMANAQAYALKIVSEAINNEGRAAADFEIRKVQAEAISRIGHDAASKIILLPADILDGLRDVAGRVLPR